MAAGGVAEILKGGWSISWYPLPRTGWSPWACNWAIARAEAKYLPVATVGAATCP